MKRLISGILLSLSVLMFAGCGDSGPGFIFFPPAITITTASPLPAGTVGVAYSETLAVSGGTAPFTWALATGSTLPAGLTLSAAGVISGTPTTAATSTFTITVTDSATHTTSKQFSLTVSAVGALTITTASLPGGTVGTAYNQTLAATGGTGALTWSISTGALPAGLSLTPATGVISGTPTTAATANFTVMVTDSATPTPHTATKALSITVVAAPSVLTITTTSLPGGTVGTAYNQTLAATGGTGILTWQISVGALPAGLSLNPTTGLISGTPTTAATANFTVKVTDSATPTANTATQPLSITVAAAPSALTITTTSLPVEVLGTAYNQTLTATGGTGALTWSISAGALPTELTLAPATGVISGSPTIATTANFTVKVTDSLANTASQALSITSSTAAGLAAFTTNCSSCHGTLTPGVGVSGAAIPFPSSITALNAAIAANTGNMGFLSSLGAATLSAIAGVLH